MNARDLEALREQRRHMIDRLVSMLLTLSYHPRPLVAVSYAELELRTEATSREHDHS